MAERKRIIEASTELSGTRDDFAPLSRQIAEQWNKASVAAKKEYEMMAENDKLRYIKELEEWQQSFHDNPQAKSGALSKFLSSSSGEPASSLVASYGIPNPSKRKHTTSADSLEQTSELYSKHQQLTMEGKMTGQQQFQTFLDQQQIYSLTSSNDQLNQTNIFPPQKRARLSTLLQHETSAYLAPSSNDSDLQTLDRIRSNSVLTLAVALDTESIDFLVALFSKEQYR